MSARVSPRMSPGTVSNSSSSGAGVYAPRAPALSTPLTTEGDRARVLPARRRRKRPLGQTIAIAAGVVFFVAFALYPLVYLLSGSFKSLGEIYSGFATLIPEHPTLTNFRHLLFVNANIQQINFLTAARNSILIALMTIAFTIAVSVPAAFVLARRQAWFITGVRGWARLAQVVGGIIVIIPLYLILRHLHLVNTLVGVSLAETIPASAFGIWVLVAFVRQVPYDIEEAARIDGAGEWTTLRRVVVPLIRPGITSVVLVVFVISWCDFLNPLILLNNAGQYTVTVALYTYIGQPGQTLWGQLLAFGLLACVPPLLVIILAERHIVRGLAAGAVK
jgi:multiple sugar transport system permease protein